MLEKKWKDFIKLFEDLTFAYGDKKKLRIVNKEFTKYLGTLTKKDLETLVDTLDDVERKLKYKYSKNKLATR